MSKGQNFWALVKKDKKSAKKNYTIRLDTKIGEAFKKRCEEEGVSMSEMVEMFFRVQLEKQRKN